MLPDLFSSTTIPALGEVLNFAQARHTVLAGNIANVNTPGYRLRDLSHDRIPAEAQGSDQREPDVGRADVARDWPTASPATRCGKCGLRCENLVYHDDTNIDLEKQVAEMTKNHLLHNFALTVMTDQFQLLQTAISERV